VDSRLYSLNPADPTAHVVNIKGNDLPHSPRASMTLGYDHTFTLPNGDALVPHIATHFETRSWLSYYNESTPIGGVSDWDQQKAYTRTDLSLTYRGQGDKKYEIEAFVRRIQVALSLLTERVSARLSVARGGRPRSRGPPPPLRTTTCSFRASHPESRVRPTAQPPAVERSRR